MRTRIAAIASVTALAGLLAACGTVDPYGSNNYPGSMTTTTTYPSTSYPSTPYSTTPVYPSTTSIMVEYGRVSNIEMVQAPRNNNSGSNIAGTVIGGVVGAVLGNQIGGGSGRDAATVLGAVGGAVFGNQIAKNRDGSYDSPTGAVYRVSVQADNGTWRSYDVATPGDLRVGDRVRIENNVLYRN
jgi:outer membrane lipoprotein SlyB